MIGDKVENFVLKDQNGNDFDLYKNLNQIVMLVFYPRDDSAVCSLQLKNYNLNIKNFSRDNIKIVGVNFGEVSEHKLFCDKMNFNFPILADVNKEISTRFSALNLWQQNKRKLILIGIDKRILFEKTVFSFLYLNAEQIRKLLKKLEII